MIDYTKTVPWRIDPGECLVGWWYVNGSDGLLVARFPVKEDAERTCLLTAAAEVQERRGWTPEFMENGYWTVTGRGKEQVMLLARWRRELAGWHEVNGEARWGPQGVEASWFKDPAAALVEADQWLTEQEKGGCDEGKP